jgi:hypothetical protein
VLYFLLPCINWKGEHALCCRVQDWMSIWLLWPTQNNKMYSTYSLISCRLIMLANDIRLCTSREQPAKLNTHDSVVRTRTSTKSLFGKRDHECVIGARTYAYEHLIRYWRSKNKMKSMSRCREKVSEE